MTPDTSTNPRELSVVLHGVLLSSWPLAATDKYPRESAGAEVITDGGTVRLIGAALRPLIGKPQLTRVAVRCSVRQAAGASIRLVPTAVAHDFKADTAPPSRIATPEAKP